MKFPYSIVPCLNVFLILNLVNGARVLKQVVILSRHNVRTPLAKNLAAISPQPWPHWKEKSGYLTKKGALLEGFMGEYFAEWLKTENLLPNGCPREEEFFVYANVKQRTLESAKSFVEHGFPSCNITINHSNSDTDTIFNPVLHNSTEIFKELALKQMSDRLRTLYLSDSYNEMSDILDYKDSELCVKKKLCNLTTDENKIISVIANQKPAVDGPLKISSSAVDAFLMEYYEGLPIGNVAWGKLNTKTWLSIMKLSKGYHNVIFNTTIVAKDIAEPLTKYLSEIFFKNKNKVTLLMGHDANMYTILNSFNFRPYILRKQYELTPVGGKIVFQKWFDSESNLEFLKLNYVYQSSKKMREGRELNLDNPPETLILELHDCKIDENGFCLWSDFIKVLKSLTSVEEKKQIDLMFDMYNSPVVIGI